MTQPRAKMRYPKGRIILVRDSTVAICLNNNPGAVLLSTLLFWYDNPHKFDTCQDNDFTMCRTQASIEEQACHQIDVKTIHDTAVPLLQLLGYLSVVEKMNGNLYTLHMDRVLAGYAAYENGPDCLKAYLKASMQLESAPIVMAPSELESALINKHWLYFELERVLIANRGASNCKRGRKPKQKAASDSQNANTETIRDSIETIDKERDSGAFAPTRTNETPYHIAADAIRNDAEEHLSYAKLAVRNLQLEKEIDEMEREEAERNIVDSTLVVEEDAPTVKMPAIKLNGATPQPPSEQTPGVSLQDAQAISAPFVSPEPVQTALPPADAQATGKPEKPKRGRRQEVQLTLQEAQIKEWYEELRGVEIMLSKRNVTALAALGKRKMSKDDFLSVTAILDSDKWFEEQKVGVDLFWIERQWENKIIFLRGHKKPLADTKKPADWIPADDDYSLAALAQIQAKRQGV